MGNIYNQQISQKIYIIHGQRVMLDSDLAELYKVETKALNLAVQMNIEIMRAFVKFRAILSENKHLAKRLDELEQKYDVKFKAVFDAIRQLVPQLPPNRRKVGI